LSVRGSSPACSSDHLSHQEAAGEGQYVILTDVAKLGHYCCAHVGDKKKWEIVVSWHRKISPGEPGIELDGLSKVCNNALITIEANGLGQSAIDNLHNGLVLPNPCVERGWQARGA